MSRRKSRTHLEYTRSPARKKKLEKTAFWPGDWSAKGVRVEVRNRSHEHSSVWVSDNRFNNDGLNLAIEEEKKNRMGSS